MSLLHTHTHTHTHRKEVETYIHMYVYSKKGRRKTSDGRQTVQNKISNKIYRITKTKQNKKPCLIYANQQRKNLKEVKLNQSLVKYLY